MATIEPKGAQAGTPKLWNHPLLCRAVTSQGIGAVLLAVLGAYVFSEHDMNTLLAWHPVVMGVGVAGFLVTAMVIHFGLPQSRELTRRRYKTALFYSSAFIVVGLMLVLLHKLYSGKSLIPSNVHETVGVVAAGLVLAPMINAVATDHPMLASGTAVGIIPFVAALMAVYSGCWLMFPDSWLLSGLVIATGAWTMVTRSCWYPALDQGDMEALGWGGPELQMAYANNII